MTQSEILKTMAKRLKWQIEVLKQAQAGGGQITLADVFPLYKAIDDTIARMYDDDELSWTLSLREMSVGQAVAAMIDKFGLARCENTELNLLDWLSAQTCDGDPSSTEVFVALWLLAEDCYPVAEELRQQCVADLTLA